MLGIETSCDETALGLVEDGRRILAACTASSLQRLRPYGGVVPEIVSRFHVELITRELENLLAQAKIGPSAVDQIAVTYGPGLSGSLAVGVAAAKALGLAWGKPVIGVNHLQAHLYAALLGRDPMALTEPAIGLVISGGHTALILMEGTKRCRALGQTRDDAVGEAFDKTAKLMSLGFPGGPEIERAALRGDPRAFRFTVPKIRGGSPYDFSFSGIKTAVLHKIQKEGSLSAGFVADLAASFQSSVVEEVVMKAVGACREHRVPRLVVGGGVIANGRLRGRLAEVAGDFGIDLALPEVAWSTDNGVMVAGLGAHLKGQPLSRLTVVPDLSVEMN